MNLASSAHRGTEVSSTPQQKSTADHEEDRGEEFRPASPGSPSMSPTDTMSAPTSGGKLVLGLSILKSTKSFEKKSEWKTERASDTVSETPTIIYNKRLDGAFLPMLGNEGVALGRQGLSLFINRPRNQIKSHQCSQRNWSCISTLQLLLEFTVTS